ncbi:hypothetical protein LLS1_02980 [Leifsonia sp. LS1]|uniref:hypothetical protein n=1 Tax=Leifsonia sp. LS1 TaxID=2828483 RepID=UPI001CFC5443|nr:hypothetical protein [Leifsonia sp. LS1]GIT78629.1 hypothetical protein LLS1_02980 [Leifsonia sp. LS1]
MTSPSPSARVVALRGRKRALLSVGALLGIGALCTTAALTDSSSVLTHLDGRSNYVALQTSAAEADTELPVWPSEAENASFTLDLGGDRLLEPGVSHTFRMAVRNASPRLATDVTMAITRPASEAADDGDSLRLFQALRFTVREGGAVVIDQAGAATVAELTRRLPDSVDSGGVRLFEIDVTLPADAADDLAGLRTAVQVAFTGTSTNPAARSAFE